MFRAMFSPIFRSNLTVYTALVQCTDLLPTGVTGCWLLTPLKYSHIYYGPGVDSASNRNEYQEYFLGVKAAGA
jgi:hypothetical protein